MVVVLLLLPMVVSIHDCLVMVFAWPIMADIFCRLVIVLMLILRGINSSILLRNKESLTNVFQRSVMSKVSTANRRHVGRPPKF